MHVNVVIIVGVEGAKNCALSSKNNERFFETDMCKYKYLEVSLEFFVNIVYNRNYSVILS
jgi:hypothetical protein